MLYTMLVALPLFMTAPEGVSISPNANTNISTQSEMTLLATRCQVCQNKKRRLEELRKPPKTASTKHIHKQSKRLT